MIDDPKKFWNSIANQENWIDFILPKRSTIGFWDEGKKEAENILKIAGEIDDSFVIDYGCGIGRIMRYFKAKRIIGLDVCEKFVLLSGKNCFLTDKYNEKNIATFIYCISVIQHNELKDRIKIIDHIHSLLKKGGKCFINFPIQGNVYKDTMFVHTFNMIEIDELFKKFSHVEVKEGNLYKYGGHEKIEGFNEYFVIATK